MIDFNYSINDVEVKNSLKRLIARTPALSRNILSLLCEAVVARSVAFHLSGQTLKRVTGTLAKSLNYRLKNDYTATVGTNVIYAAIHEFGGIILPKNKEALRFKIKDKWIMTKKVTMPKRPFLHPALEYVMANEAKQIMETRAKQWLSKEWGK